MDFNRGICLNLNTAVWFAAVTPISAKLWCFDRVRMMYPPSLGNGGG
jgi:hypothetical protein